ncbi:MAG: 3-deoxy-8-phosphooctulonate synthase [Planctomycetota bacterium]
MLSLDQLTDTPLFVFAGPCVIESEALCLRVGETVRDACVELGLRYVFKASFDKANRSSGASFRGQGLDEGLGIIERVGRKLGVPTITDVHLPEQAAAVGQVCDVLQVPAFLARQTDLLHAVGKTGRVVHVKKGQFMAPAEMKNVVAKLAEVGNEQVVLCERGTFFGYGALVNDFTGLAAMHAATGKPVCFDVTHSTQQPAGQGTQSGGNPKYSPLLARAAVAAGVDGMFVECHPDPATAKSDAASMVPLDVVPQLLRECRDLAALRSNFTVSVE